jgi:hypothetical protein
MTANAVRVNMSAEGKSQSRATESIKFPALFSWRLSDKCGKARERGGRVSPFASFFILSADFRRFQTVRELFASPMHESSTPKKSRSTAR